MERVKEKRLGRENDLTLEELKSYPMFSCLTDEQAAEILDTIKKFTIIIYDLYVKNNAKSL